MARAMSHIDDALIEEANETPVRRAKILTPKVMKNITRFGSIAACVILVIGIMIVGNRRGSQVLLYGESVSDSPRTITEYMPRAVTHLVDPALITEVSLPLELEFKKETKLHLTEGSMMIIDENGETLYEGLEYTANGKVSMILSFPGNAPKCIIETNRGYNIVLTQDGESHIWYVNIEK